MLHYWVWKRMSNGTVPLRCGSYMHRTCFNYRRLEAGLLSPCSLMTKGSENLQWSQCQNFLALYDGRKMNKNYEEQNIPANGTVVALHWYYRSKGYELNIKIIEYIAPEDLNLICFCWVFLGLLSALYSILAFWSKMLRYFDWFVKTRTDMLEQSPQNVRKDTPR